MHPPGYYYLWEIKNYVVGVSSNGITLIPNFMEINPRVQKN
jgi:hypothetical protein